MIEVISRTFTPEILMYLLGGAWLVIELSVIIVILSLFFGLILALLRSYDKFILGRLAGAYIEIFRNTPNLMWVLICYVHAPLPTASQTNTTRQLIAAKTHQIAAARAQIQLHAARIAELHSMVQKLDREVDPVVCYSYYQEGEEGAVFRHANIAMPSEY